MNSISNIAVVAKSFQQQSSLLSKSRGRKYAVADMSSEDPARAPSVGLADGRKNDEFYGRDDWRTSRCLN